jgi:hypothetical protein
VRAAPGWRVIVTLNTADVPSDAWHELETLEEACISQLQRTGAGGEAEKFYNASTLDLQRLLLARPCVPQPIAR